jgi:STE24 endopeptidase
MSNLRALVLLLAVVGLCAGILAVVSRAPAELRGAKPGPQATNPDLGAAFSDLQVRRHAAYVVPGYVAVALTIVIQLTVLVVLASGPLARVVDGIRGWPPEWLGRLGPMGWTGAWPVQAVAAGGFLAVALFLSTVPLDYVRTYATGHAWGLYTQGPAGWLWDEAKSLLVTLVTTVLGVLAFYAVVRAAPRTWWLWGWLVFSALTFVMVYLYPVVITPLFNRFTPLEDRSLTQRIERLARAAGVDVNKVLVSDASRRTTAENAYVAGLGPTKEVVLYDTLLRDSGEDEIAFVVAHEIGHAERHHVVKGALVSCAGLLAAFALGQWLAGHAGIWRLSGAEGAGDVKGLALVALYVLAASVLSLPLQTLVSRHFEAQADAIAIHLTRDPDAGVRQFRALAFSNLADLRPPGVVVATLFTHPPIPDRIRAILEEAGREP